MSSSNNKVLFCFDRNYLLCFFGLYVIKKVIYELIIIMANEWSVVAMLYVCKENNVKICRATFILYNTGASVVGCNFVLRNVGIKAITSIVTTIIIETVGSLNIIHGIRPSNAKIR